MNDDRRLIEDYLPIEAISAEASRASATYVASACCKPSSLSPTK